MSPTPVRSRILVLICVADHVAEQVVRSCVEGAQLSPPPPFTSVSVEVQSLSASEDRIRKAYRWSGNTGVLLISDGLVEEDPPALRLTSAGKELYALFGEKLYATVALAAAPRRVTDVDRVAPLRGPADALLQCVHRCLDRLAYLRPPDRPAVVRDVVVRPIEFDHHMTAYLRLRHRVYTTMCYLNALIEEYPGELEVDWCDTRSLHFGAFDGERLVGTARLILTRPPDGSQVDLVTRVMEAHPLLRQVVENGAIQNLLPVFQSQLRLGGLPARLNALFDRVAADDILVGEVSRVIVDHEYRGYGLSRRLTERLVEAARAREVSDLLLECLPGHAAVYAPVGFERLGTSGNVYGIYRTMIAMHRELTPQPTPAVT